MVIKKCTGTRLLLRFDTVINIAMPCYSSDFHIFAIMLVQRPVRVKNKPLLRTKPFSRQEWRNMSKELQDQLKKEFLVIHDRVLQVMKDMPKGLLLIFR